jgi:hypothetical protein
VENGHVVQHEFAADYDEGFLYWYKYAPSPDVVGAQKRVATELEQIASKAVSATERERLDYLAGFVGFAVPYTDSWTLAHQLNGILDEAAKLKSQKHIEEAREKVRTEVVPLWMKIAPLVRDTMLRYQRIVSTREDLGQLASMHNKYVRLALVRLRLSIQEYLGDLPVEMETLYKRVIEPDDRAQPRLIVPTRPGILNTNNPHFRITILAAGSEPVREVTLHTRVKGSRTWTAVPATVMGRRSYIATVGPFAPGKDLASYYVSALMGSSKHVSPPGGANDPYLVTLL